MQNRSAVIVFIALLAFSCGPQQSVEQASLNGTWESIGSGWILQIQDSSQYTIYDITSISCLPNHKGPLNEISGALSLKKDTLSLLKGVITYSFIRTEKLPTLCQSTLDEKKSKDPEFNFEVFSETVKEHYAFFELNQLDWESLYQEQKQKISETSTDVELYQVIEETLERLNDNHAFLEATDEVYEALEEESIPEEETDTEALPEYGDFQVAQMVAEHHFQEELTKNSGLIQWGKLTDSIGYIQVKSMWLYADLNLAQELIDEVGYVDAYVQTFHQMYEGDYIQKEVQGVRKVMDRVVEDLADMDAMVIDVRFNGGGQDAVSFEILRRFIPQKIRVATQKLRYGDQYTPILPLYIEGATSPYTKPVYVLTSSETGSAAEAFSISTMAVDHIKRIGSPTSGAMSTALEKTLPNGWPFAISNEIYMDLEGNSYENIGIPVDYDLHYPRDRQTFFRSVVEDLDQDKSNILMAIEKLIKK